MLKDHQVVFLFFGNTVLASLFGSLFHLGIMDPDSKSAASWGDASKGPQRQPVEEAVGGCISHIRLALGFLHSSTRLSLLFLKMHGRVDCT